MDENLVLEIQLLIKSQDCLQLISFFFPWKMQDFQN